ncbi:NRDE family protein [Falsiroseomonas oryzae]|uniref:NRDE family protein n=1 Tax=Falsiroseomonas oryzae TaxID=2766473 RepID=UPI0022EB1E85|nr:NRDE family protein [Roseomonas sp. MO-31]
MCTVVILRRPGHDWPLLLAANRDERLDRAWDAPAAHWPDRPGMVGGRDRTGGGTWMALQGGVLAAVLNRPGSLGPAPGKRSRGELPLMALDAGTAAAAAAAVAGLDAGQWRPFNMVVADARDAIFLRGLGAGRPEPVALPPGVSMVTAHDPNDLASPRTRRHLPRFRTTPPPDPAAGDWAGWEALLADGDFGAEGLGAALNVPPVQGFGTVCSSLLALGAGGARVWRFCAGRPAPGRFAPLDLGEDA